jgi:hypothetical protein
MSERFRTEKQLREFMSHSLGGHWQPIEDMQSTGIPDANYCIPTGKAYGDQKSSEGWLEFKVATLPRKHATLVTVGLRPVQCAWLTRRSIVGGNCGVLIGFNTGELMLVNRKEYFPELLTPIAIEDLKCLSAFGDFILDTDVELMRGQL